MKNEIKIFYDKECKNESSKEIIFEPVLAGKNSKKSLFIQNLIPYPANLNISIEGNGVEIIKNIKELKPNEVKEIVFLLKPKLTTIKPIKVKLNIKGEYIIG